MEAKCVYFYYLQAIVGQFIFEESVSLMWWLGTVLIIVGLVLMNHGAKKSALRKNHKRIKSR